jgi:hypothetical protein
VADDSEGFGPVAAEVLGRADAPLFEGEAHSARLVCPETIRKVGATAASVTACGVRKVGSRCKSEDFVVSDRIYAPHRREKSRRYYQANRERMIARVSAQAKAKRTRAA